MTIYKLWSLTAFGTSTSSPTIKTFTVTIKMTFQSFMIRMILLITTIQFRYSSTFIASIDTK